MRLAYAYVIAAALLLSPAAANAGDAAPDKAADQSGPPTADQPQGQPAEQQPNQAPAEPADNKPADNSQNCVDVQIGNDRSAYLDCLNSQMKKGAEREHNMPQPTAPIDAQSPSNQVGTFNEGAARQKMGNAFGKSAQPQRPKSTFNNPLIH